MVFGLPTTSRGKRYSTGKVFTDSSVSPSVFESSSPKPIDFRWRCKDAFKQEDKNAAHCLGHINKQRRVCLQQVNT